MSELLRAIDASVASGQCVEIAIEGSSFDIVSFLFAVVDPDCTRGEVLADGSIEGWGESWFVRVIRF